MSDYFVYSTLTASNIYTLYDIEVPHTQSAPVTHQVTIHGGHGLVNDKSMTNGVFHTPKGVMTRITEAEYEALLKNEVFRTHLENNFITVEKKEHEVAKVAENLKQADLSAPLTAKDLPKGVKEKPIAKE